MKLAKTWLWVALLSMAPLVQAVEDESHLESLRKQAAAGSVPAQYEMGVLYEFGFHMKDNLPHALAWYMVAAEGGDQRAAQRRDLLQNQMNPADLELAHRLKSELGATKPATDVPAPAADKPANP
jgi:TPR repeat protein